MPGVYSHVLLNLAHFNGFYSMEYIIKEHNKIVDYIWVKCIDAHLTHKHPG